MSILAPFPSKSFMISRDPDSAQSCKAVFPLIDFLKSKSLFFINYRLNNSWRVFLFKPIHICIHFHEIFCDFVMTLVAGYHETGMTVSVRNLHICQWKVKFQFFQVHLLTIGHDLLHSARGTGQSQNAHRSRLPEVGLNWSLWSNWHWHRAGSATEQCQGGQQLQHTTKVGLPQLSPHRMWQIL